MKLNALKFMENCRLYGILWKFAFLWETANFTDNKSWIRFVCRDVTHRHEWHHFSVIFICVQVDIIRGVSSIWSSALPPRLCVCIGISTVWHQQLRIRHVRWVTWWLVYYLTFLHTFVFVFVWVMAVHSVDIMYIIKMVMAQQVGLPTFS